MSLFRIPHFLQGGHLQHHKEAYEFGEVLGQGGFGIVTKAHDVQHNMDVAIKKVRLLPLHPSSPPSAEGQEGARAQVPKRIVKEREAYKRVLNFVQQMDHPNCIRLLEWFSSSNNYYVVFELATGGDLIDRIVEEGGHLTEADAKGAVRSILSATAYLHERNVIHRDIKLDNYLLRSKGCPADQLVLIDFGQSAMLTAPDIKLTEMCGSPTYIAPEVYERIGYSFPVDMWAIGTVTFNLLSGRSLYSTSADFWTIARETVALREVRFADEFWHDVSEEAKDFIRKLLKHDPDERMTVEEALSHPWITQPTPTAPRRSSVPKDPEVLADAHAPLTRQAPEPGVPVSASQTLRLAHGERPDDVLEPHPDPEESDTVRPLPPKQGGGEGRLARDKEGEEMVVSEKLHRRLSVVSREQREQRREDGA